ncbi:MAG: SpoIIE family protein phosphatase [Ignavibacteriales bacterium]|nr:SpoIIE family protein phosphatase [Ignavibacteriales bacterium]
MLLKKLINIYFASIFVLANFASAQTGKDYYFENISIPDGLSNTQVWDIIQDKYGFLWIATQDGLNRYDGYSFKIYKNDLEDNHSLPNNQVQTVLFDKDENFLIGTQSGFSIFDRVSESFTNLLVDSTNITPPSNNVSKIFQDSKGRIWLGTGAGIYLFNSDKMSFTLMSLKNNDKSIRTDGTVFSINESTSGQIYAGFLFSGLIKFNEEEQLFEKIIFDSKNEDLFKGNLIFSLFEDKTGKMWICSNNGLFTYDPNTSAFEKIKLFESEVTLYNTSTVTDIFQDVNGYLWITTASQGIYRYNLRTNKITQLSQNSFPEGVSSTDPFFKFYMDEFGVLWIPTFGKGILKLDFQKEPFRLYTKPGGVSSSNNNMRILSLLKSKTEKDITWLGTTDGLYKYNLSDKTFKQFKSKKGDSKSLPSNRINTMLAGENAGLWLGTANGLSYYNTIENKFTNYDLTDSNEFYSSSFNFVNDITIDDYGTIWLATGVGIVRFDPKTKLKTFLKGQEGKTYDTKLLSYIASKHNKKEYLSAILEVGDYQDLKQEFEINETKNVLVVSVGEGLGGMWDYGFLTDSNNDTLFIHKNKTDVFNYFSGNGKNRIFVKVLTLKKGKYKLRYVSDDSHSYGNWNTVPPKDSTWWGIQAFEIDEADLEKVNGWFKESANTPFVQGTTTNIVKYQKDGTLIIGTNQGLSKYFISQNKIENYIYPHPIPNSINTQQINDIYIEEDGNIWLATMGGLINYNQNTNTYNIIYDKDGLPSNYLQSIQKDNYGNLWISTLNGITKFNKDIRKPIFINYDVKDGLQSYTFTKNCSYKSENGELFFGGINGFNAFMSGNINKMPPKVNIAELKINNKTVLPNTDDSPLNESILDTKDLVLDYAQNNISFEFNSIHFSRPEKNKNAYMLEGFDQDGWIYSDRKFATYTNLPEGKYVFKVKGANGDGIWNEAGTSINIKILPPWWRTIWAYLSYVLLFAGAVFLVNKYQKRKLLAKTKERMKIQEAEYRAEAAELQARAIEAESQRKTQELEEARELQLSMLPRSLPQLPHLDIAVYMQTATEVGGDYYDFHVGLDGTLTVVLGDATGHGMKAGTMVTSTKSLFNALAPNPNIIETFHEMTRCLKLMQMEKLSMCMTMLKITGSKVQMSAAGMPPVLHYKRENQSIEELVMKGMPLGTISDFPYTLIESDLNSGDTLLLVSDGLPELFNRNKEMFSYKRMRDVFEENAQGNPEEIIKHLKNAASDWVDGKDPDDDVTFVVLKVK